MAHYVAQGKGINAKPHLLIPTIDPWWNGGVKWTVQCPYEGPRECGLVEECNGTEEDVARWGCEPFPAMPGGYGSLVVAMPEGYDGLVVGPLSEERRAAWRKFEQERDRWEDEVHGGYRWHRTEECWFATVAVPNSDFEPEYFLSDIPRDTPINGPIKVLVGYEGQDEDTEPKFKLWEEPTHADS